METATHVIVAYTHNPRWQPGGQRSERFSQPIAACRSEIPSGDELVSLYDVREEPEALAAEEVKITCKQCQAWLADEDNRLRLLDTAGWLRKHIAAGDRDIRYIDIPVSGDDNA